MIPPTINIIAIHPRRTNMHPIQVSASLKRITKAAATDIVTTADVIKARIYLK